MAAILTGLTALVTGAATGIGRATALALAAEGALAGQTVLDFGCGSGILAIAAAKHGATEVDAVDIDEVGLADLRRPGGPRRPHPGSPSQGRRRGGAHGAPGTTRGGRLSKSVAKALRAGIGREKKRGISTILLRRSSPIGAFATDLDNRPSGRLNEHPELRPRWGA